MTICPAVSCESCVRESTQLRLYVGRLVHASHICHHVQLHDRRQCFVGKYYDLELPSPTVQFELFLRHTN